MSSRSALRQPISRRRELALQFGVLVGIGVIAALLTLLGVLLHGGDARQGRHDARLQLERELEPGEQVLARAEVTQRRWWDHFRATPGVLAATDRRLLYVGRVPPALFRPTDDPPTFAAWSTPYDTALDATLQRRLPAGAGVAVRRRGDGRERFVLRPGQGAAADAVVDAVVSRRAARLAELRRQQAIVDSITRLPPPPPLVHRVRPGETLFGIAGQYNVTPEVLQAMNGRTGDRIRIGEELVVRRYRRIGAAVVEYFGPA